MKTYHGGRREGAGKPKGVRWPSSIKKEWAREALRSLVLAELWPLVKAQITNAKGLSHLFLRDEQGKFIQITDPIVIETVLNSGEQDKYFYIQTKDPSIQAFTDLMNRALDKPAEHVELTGADGQPLRIIHELPE